MFSEDTCACGHAITIANYVRGAVMGGILFFHIQHFPRVIILFFLVIRAPL
jgi:hypothetical protein